MRKAPKNKSLSWEIIAAASPLLVLGAMAPTLGKSLMSPEMLQLVGIGSLATAGMMAAHSFVSDNPVRQLKVVFEYCGLYTEKESGISTPRLLKKEKIKNGLRLTYSIPIGLCKSDFDKEIERMEQAVGGEVSIREKNGLLFVTVAHGEIPDKALFTAHTPDFPKDYILPITLGVSRAGLEFADLVDFPHLLDAGQTLAGKTVLLHQIIARLAHNPKCRLFLIDLKKVDFVCYKKHAWFAATVPKAHEILSYLVAELDRRLDVMESAGVEKIQNYKGDDMPYLVCIIDEFSHLCPSLAKHDVDKRKKEMREHCHSMLVDLLCRARSVGIHLIISTQRPDHEVLPGQMKANIPATVCFQVRNKVNSQICLDNDKAASLPGVPGRAIYQFGNTEKEIQGLLVSVEQAKQMLPVVPITHPGDIVPNDTTPQLPTGEF